MTRPPDGRVVLVTGGTSGIGLAVARRLAQQHAHVVVTGIDEEEGERVLAELQSHAASARFVLAPLGDRPACELVFSTIERDYGRLDAAVNNASLGGANHMIAEIEDDEFQSTIETNLVGTWRYLKHEIGMMLRLRKGVIVNVASMAGVVAFTKMGAYAAGKSAILGLTRCAALEYADEGIRINSISPGVVDTPSLQKFMMDQELTPSELVDNVPVGRMANPDEIAAGIIWLLAPESSYITGHNLIADGGYTIH